MENTCEKCIWWDCGLCDRIGRLTEEDDHCKKWEEKEKEKKRQPNEEYEVKKK